MKWIMPLLFFAAPLQAEQAMSGAEFDAYTRGKTFYYADGDAPYGGEEYLENRRVRWSFLDGKCKDGTWYESGGMICFVYEEGPDPQCWTFFQSFWCWMRPPARTR